MAAGTGQAPFTPTLQVASPAVAAGADFEMPCWTNNTGGTVTVTGVTYIPAATITGAATNNRTFTVFDRGTGGAGTTTVATLNMANGINAAAFTARAIALSGTAANLDVLANEVLTFQSLHVGTGIADPGGLVQITVSRA